MPRSTRPTAPIRQRTRITLDPSTAIAELGLLLPSEAAQLLKVRESWLRRLRAHRAAPIRQLDLVLPFCSHCRQHDANGSLPMIW
jgi:hypothetical protein